MLTTLVRPTGGRAWVAGHDVTREPVEVKRRIGVVTQNNTLDMQLTVAENLQFRSRFFGQPARTATRPAGQLIDAFGLGDRRNAMAHRLSGGQARRLLIARALVHKPDVLFLDEPTAGLDPQTRVNRWDILTILVPGLMVAQLLTQGMPLGVQRALDDGRVGLGEERRRER